MCWWSVAAVHVPFCTNVALKQQKLLKCAAVVQSQQSSDRDILKLPRFNCRPDQPWKRRPRQSVFSSSRRNLALFWIPYKFLSLVFRSTWLQTRKIIQAAVFSHSTIFSHTKSPKFQPFYILSSSLPHISLYTPFPSIFGKFCKQEERSLKRKLSPQWVFSTPLFSLSFFHWCVTNFLARGLM